MQTASRPRTATRRHPRPLNRPATYWAFLLFLILTPAASLLAQTGTADGTYTFASLSSTSNSGGTGYKTQQDKFIVSNIFIQVSTNRMYANNGTAGASQFVELKANNSLVKTFTLKDMRFQNGGPTNYALSRFDIVLKDYSGNTIASHTLASSVSLNTSGTTSVAMSTFPFSAAWPAAGYNNVNSVEITFQYSAANVHPDNMDWVNWTLANISNATPTSLTTGTISGSPFCAGSSVSVPYTASGMNSGNTFTAQLSDASGSFASPTTLGTVTTTSSGNIAGTIPTSIGTGTGYRIRVVANNPATNATDNGSNLTINAKPSATISGFSNIACYNGSTGSVTVTASGGTPSYTYSWSPSGGTGATASNLTANTYTVTVQDSKGCQATATKAITQPASALTASSVVTNVSCFGGSTGAVSITPSGGTSPYTYNWGSGVTSQNRTGLVAGTYGVTVTDANSCTYTIFPISVNQPSAAVSGSTVVTNVACFGGSTGSIDLTPAGGTSPYTFAWNGGATTEDRSGLSTGTYSVTITDANNCQATVSNIAVSQPSSAVSGSTVVTNVSCFGGSTGSIDLTPAGGTAGYTYQWNDGATTQDRSNLPAANYSVTITDANNCQTTVSNITVGQPSAAVSGSTVVTNVACFGGNTGSINLTPAGGTSPYTFAWNGGATTEDRSNLVAGNYSVTITDAHNCQATISNIAVGQPSAPVSGSTVVTNVACFGGNTGAINLTPAGGTSPYTFAWNGGATTEDRTNLVAGSYNVTITDANNCQATISNISVGQPSAAVSGSTVVTNVACFGGNTGAINLTPAGGTSPYTFAWNGGATTEDRTSLVAGNYSVTITDANNCQATISNISVGQPSSAVSGSTVVTNVSCFGGNTGSIDLTPAGGTPGYTYLWNGGATTEDRSNLTAGNYSVVITDANGCQATISNISVGQPSAAVSGSTVVTNVACFGGNTGAINLTPAGGTSPYTFLWNGGATTEDRTNLVAGSYSVTITDANGCQATISNISVGQPASAVSGSTVVTNVACFGGNTGAINLTPAGGTPGYTFLWNGGATTEDRTSLTAGNYSVTITDANGCQATVANIAVDQPSAPVSGSAVVTDVSCNGAANGTINLTPAGGTPGYTYLWNDAATSQDRMGLSPGTYSVTITDANGCQSTVGNLVVEEPYQPMVNAVSSQTVCNGHNTLAISFSGAATSYSWTNSASSIGLAASGSGNIASFSAVNNGTTPVVATITVTPLNGSCTGTPTSFTITVNPTPNASIAYTAAPYYTGSGTATVTQTGTTGGTYSSTAGIVLNAATGTIDLAASVPGTYTVTYTIAAAGGCNLFSTNTSITLINPFSATISYAGSPYCDASGTASVTLVGTQGANFSSTAGLAIDATTGDIDLAASTPGTYTVRYGTPSDFTTTLVSIRPTNLIDPVPNQVFCNGTSSTAVTFTGAYGLTFNWTATNGSVGTGNSGSASIPAFIGQNPGTTLAQNYIYVYAQGGTGCATNRPMVYRYNVKPSPVVTAVADQTICAGMATTAVNFASTLNNTTFSWTNTNSSIGLNAVGTGNIPAFNAVNNSGALQVATVTASSVAAGCVGNTVTYNYNVSPSAGTLSYGSSPYCQSGPAYPRSTGSEGGTYTATPAGLNLNAATGQVNLALSQPGTYTVTYTVGAAGSCNPTASAQLTILPQASVDAMPNLEYCNGVVAPATPFSGTASSYNWVNDNPSIGLAASGSGASLPSFTTVNPGPGARYAYIKVSPQGNGSTQCPSKPVAFRITVRYCGPVAQSGGTGGDAATQRTMLAQQFEVGPNPARGNLVLQYSGNDGGPFTVQLVSQYGQPIGRVFTMSGTTYTLDLTNVTPGAYSLQVTQVRTGITFNKQVIKL